VSPSEARRASQGRHPASRQATGTPSVRDTAPPDPAPPVSPALPLTLSVAEAADLLGVSGYTVRQLIREGRLRAVDLGSVKAVRIPSTEVLRLVRGEAS
jgi:excisionase family DNA binding protein